MYSGNDAIDFLAKEIYKFDNSSSSHWQKYHSKFKFNGNGFEGLQGFGGHSKPRGKLTGFIEKILQYRFRKMAGRNFSMLDNLAHEVTIKQNRNYDLDVLRQALTISFLNDRAPNLLNDKAIGCVIGDGFGSMSLLLLLSRSANRVILVNLTKTLMVDLWYLKLYMGDHMFKSSVDLISNSEELQAALVKPTSNLFGNVIAIQADNHQILKDCKADFILNIASMQEMNPATIGSYFEDIRSIADKKKVVFYCCNREEKTLPDGTVTRFSEYPFHPGDNVMIDSLCPWHQYYYSFKPPFYRSYDGPLRHRLVEMINNKEKQL
ncbi:sugar O-methyltransferase [Alphaproteobacteria bacterium]|nr:sugar O-methyltransferase [Alphaproteobacteria bacterium]